jgi:hypothetical protein
MNIVEKLTEATTCAQCGRLVGAGKRFVIGYVEVPFSCGAGTDMVPVIGLCLRCAGVTNGLRARWRRLRIRCTLLGCFVSDEPACPRCHSDLYSSEFLQSGLLDPMLCRLHHVRAAVSLRYLRCAHCGRFLSPRRLWQEWRLARRWGAGLVSTKFCSDDCDDSYFPF